MSGELNSNLFGRLKEYLKRKEESLGIFLFGLHYRGTCPISNEVFEPLYRYISTPSKQTHEVRCSDCGEKISGLFY